ncbi:MAG: hypothetical protein LUH11_02640, partial [Candidatus Gastranaerophilales bacterium]|nr:hypothetical protein [Candidatus Gastranaerophilales bacterium]
MNYNEFAEKVKTKYPQYNNLDNRLLAEKVIKKYPQYTTKVSFDDETELPKNSNLLIGGISKNVSTPYMDIPNNSNLTKEQKSAKIKELYDNEIHQAELEKQESIKANAKLKLANREQKMKEHPILQTFNKFLNPVYDAETNLLKERAEYGTTAPLKVKIGNTFKRGVMGGLTTLADAAMLIPGASEIKAAHIAKTIQGANTANKISNMAKVAGYGALGFGSQEFADSMEDLLNNNAANKDVLDRTLKGTLTGALAGGLSYGSYGAFSKPVENIVKKTAENKVYNILANAQKKGQVATKEQIDNLIKKEINKINDNIIKGFFVKSAKTIPATAVDTASMALADYGLNSLQGKQKLSLSEQFKSYAPLFAFGTLPAVSHIVGKPAKKVLESNIVKDFVNNNNNVSNLTAQISNAFGFNSNYENAKKFQELDKKLQSYNMPAQKHYSKNQINFSEKINNLSDKEKILFLQYLTKGINIDDYLYKTI